jgi:hypothetical protein
MLKIEVKYRPVRWISFTRKVKSNVPQNWSDVTQKQLMAISSLYKSTISDIGFMKAMSGLKMGILKRLSDFENYKIMELIDFIGEQKSHHEFIIRKLSGSHHPVLYAPSPMLKGVTFGQFIFADTYFANYQQSGDEADLNKFIASLYLGKNEKFEQHLIQERFEIIGKLEINIRQAIVLNYQLIHEWLALAYPLIFQKQSETISDANIDKASPVSDSSSWIKVFQNFVGDDIIHDEAWAAKPVNTIFSYMTRKYKENTRTRNK